MADKRKELDALRREIDRIDDTIHDLIMERTTIVEKVRNVKHGERIKIRPGREAEIVYRLMERHRGAFPRRELVRMWRELIVATLSFEGPFSVAVYVPEAEPAVWDLARDQYGSFTPMSRLGNPRAAIQAVRDRQATVGVLPLPRSDDEDPWWRHLMATTADAPRVIARLPVAATGRGDQPEGLVICPIANEATGRDRTYLALETDDGVTADQMMAALKAVRLKAAPVAFWREDGPPSLAQHLFDVGGYVAPDDRRLDRLIDALDVPEARVLVLGGYAEPLTKRELDRIAPLASEAKESTDATTLDGDADNARATAKNSAKAPNGKKGRGR